MAGKELKMDENAKPIGIGFFGTVMASISHELKNRIAIIKEHAGLLKDYSAMAARGRQIDMERLGRLGEALTEQVAKADRILKNMNQMSHSVDELFRPTDLNELLKLLIDLAQRPANMHRIMITFSASESPVTVRTSPFLFMNLIWLHLETLFNVVEDAQTIELKLEKRDGGGALIRILMSDTDVKTDMDLIPENLTRLSAILDVGVEWNSEKNAFVVRVPEDITTDRLKGDLGILFNHLEEKENHD